MLILLKQNTWLNHGVCSCLRVNSDNNYGIFERTVEQVVHQQGGPEKCPWTKDIIEGSYHNHSTCISLLLGCHYDFLQVGVRIWHLSVLMYISFITSRVSLKALA